MVNSMKAALTVLLAATVVLTAGCDSEGSLQIRGQVVEVVPRNFSELELLRIRDDEGRVHTFETEGFVGFTPSHVREHQFLGQTLLVTYERREDILVAVSLED